MKLGMKLAFIMNEINIACKIGSYIHLLECISAKIAEEIRKLAQEFGTRTTVSIRNQMLILRMQFFVPQLNL